MRIDHISETLLESPMNYLVYLVYDYAHSMAGQYGMNPGFSEPELPDYLEWRERYET